MQPLRRIRAVMRKELRLLLRDRFYLFMALILPVITLVIMGYGLTYDVKGLPLGVVDLDQSAESRRFVETFTVSGYFRHVMRAWSADALDRAMEAGRIRVGLVIPPGFARVLDRGEPAEAQIFIDASFSTRAEIARGYAEAIVAHFNHERLLALAERAPSGTPTLAGLVFVVAMTGLGLLVSILARTQVAALLLTGTIVMAVGLFYSGWVSPVSTLDEAGRAVSRLLPTADFMTLR